MVLTILGDATTLDPILIASISLDFITFLLREHMLYSLIKCSISEWYEVHKITDMGHLMVSIMTFKSTGWMYTVDGLLFVRRFRC